MNNKNRLVEIWRCEQCPWLTQDGYAYHPGCTRVYLKDASDGHYKRIEDTSKIPDWCDLSFASET